MENPTKKAGVTLAYRAGRQAVLGMPRWLIIAGIAVGIVVKWLGVKYSLPQSESYILAFIAVGLFGRIAVAIMAFSSRKQRP
jgi:high-affinity Fe2+/Pb2+ permease